MVAELSETKRRLLELRLRKPLSVDISGTPRAERASTYPLSYAQERLWLLQQMHPESVAYNVPRALRIRGPLNVESLGKSLNAIVERHAILRTSYSAIEGSPVQIIGEPANVDVQEINLSVFPAAERETELRRIQIAEAREPFDLQRDLMLRAKLVRLSQHDHVLLLTTHHIASDGISKAIFLRELAEFYEAYDTGRPVALTALPIHYVDYAVWERNADQKQALARHIAYWKKQLAGAPALLELPTDRPRTAVQSLRGERQAFNFSKELLIALKNLAQKEGVTLFMTLLAAFDVLLHRYSSQEDIVVGTPIANRHRSEVANLIGYFSNAAVLRTDLSGDPTFVELLQRVRRVAVDAYEHQEVPFDLLVREMRIERNLSHSPLFQVMFSLNVPGPELKIAGLEIEPMLVERGEEKFDLLVGAGESAHGLSISFEYNSDLFETSTMARMGTHFEKLLEGIVADPKARLSHLSFLSKNERRQLLVEWNSTAADYPNSCVHGLFEAQANRMPEAIAVEHEGRQLTYRELDERANQLARRLQKLGVSAETRVGILMNRGLELAVALLGVLKAGGACVPLDPNYPAERLRLMLEDSQIPVLLTHPGREIEFLSSKIEQLCLDATWQTIERESRERVISSAQPDSIAYVIYTSGSTGTPKGVLLAHRGLVNHHVAAVRLYGMNAADRVLQLSSISFDIALEEIFPTWTCGGTVVFRSEQTPLNAHGFFRWAEERDISVLDLPTAYWHELVRELQDEPRTLPRSLRLVIVGGEKAAVSALVAWKRLAGEGLRWVNTYGPTEASIIATSFEPAAEGWSANDGRELPIGKPVANTRIYVLNRCMSPLPIGVPGEMFIGGPGVACGYLNQSELTAQKFVDDPFSSTGGKLYRTGDLVRYRPDGNLEFVGRVDHQVKLRGFRVELGEIESVLRQHLSVRDAVVIAREEASNKRLIAYVVASNANESELRNYLKDKLPDYMVPAAFVLLDAIPLNANGKVDRKALPVPALSLDLVKEYVAPHNAVEEVVAGIWAEVLGLPRVGVNDDFFELGGHSLIAMQVLSRMRKALSVELPLRGLFETPTVAGLAERIRALPAEAKSELPPLVPVGRNRPLPLSFAQQRLWFMNQLEPGSPFYNIPWTQRIKGPLDKNLLERSLSEIVRRHEALRTRFVTVNDEPAQIIAPAQQVPLEFLDLSEASNDSVEQKARRAVAAEAERGFDLSNNLLLRAKLLQLQPNDHVLVLTMHHIASDAWSVGVLARELWTLYGAFSHGQPSPLPELRIQYPDHAVWQRQRLSGKTLETLLAYWRRRLQGVNAILSLPFDRPRPAAQDFSGGKYISKIPAKLAGAITELSRNEGTTQFIVLLAAYQTLLSRYSGTDDFLLGTDVANRLHLETEGLIGFFVNLVAVRSDLAENPSFHELLRRTHRNLTEAYAHQELPFERLVEELRLERSSSYNPLVQALFVQHTVPKPSWRIPEIQVKPFGSSSNYSRFDLAVFVVENEEGLGMHWVYKTGLFEAFTIERLAAQYERLLLNIVANPEARLGALEHITEAERQERELRMQARKDSKLKKFTTVRVKPVEINLQPDAAGAVSIGQEKGR